MTHRVRTSLLAVPFVLVAVLAAQKPDKIDLVAPTKPLTPADEKKAFRLPPGFEAQLVASEPDIAKPLNIAFDARGRLWVTDTLEYPFAVPVGKKGRDSVKILEDFGHDGKARKITTFAGGLNIPIGLLPLQDKALVHSIPAIHQFEDTDGDGKADKSSVLYEKFGHVDTHGMTNAFTWNFDGWVYATHGFRNDSTVKGKDGSTIVMNSGNTYRFRIDGSRVEQVTWGQVNPFGLSLDPLGYLYSSDCHSMPIYQLIRGAYYPSFGKAHDGLDFGPMMLSHLHYSTGIAGITYYAADHFPKEYRGNIFIGNVVTSRINYDRIDWRGTSPWAVEQPDFLISDDPWFRPVDIKLGPDGALYVADFYNKIIGHYEVDINHPERDRHRGRIWRIVYKGEDGKQEARVPRDDWTKASIAELIDDLGHPNLTVRMFATHQLTLGTKADVVKAVRAVLNSESKPTQRAHGMWVVERLDSLDADQLAELLGDRDGLVRVHACRVLGERAKLAPKESELLRKLLRDADAHVRRAAAEALGRHPDSDNPAPLLDLLRRTDEKDTHLRHVVRIALRDTIRSNAGRIDVEKIDERDHAALGSVLLGIPSAEGAKLLRVLLGRGKLPEGDLPRFALHVSRHGGDDEADRVLAAMDDLGSSRGRKAAVLLAVEQGASQRGGRLSATAVRWGTALTSLLLESSTEEDVQAGLTLCGILKLADRFEQVSRTATDATATEGRRLAAVEALARIDTARCTPPLGKIAATAGSDEVRRRAATMLSRLNTAESRTALIAGVQAAPATLQTVFAELLATSRDGAEALLAAVETGKASPRLLQERGVEGRLKNAKPRDVEKRIAALTMGLPAADRKILDLMKKRRDGFLASRPDPALGQKVFEKNCAACHQLAGKGAKIGPQLDGIGIRGLERLLEDTLDPNRNVDRAFRTTILNLKKGQVIQGLLVREEGAVLIMADNQGKEVRIDKADVEERSVSSLSPMPATLADQVPEADFHHLMAYLLTQKRSDK